MPFAISGALAYHFMSAYDLHTVCICIGAATGEVVSRLCSTGLGRLHRSDAGGLRIVDLYDSALGDTLEFVGTFCLGGHHFDVLGRPSVPTPS